jgi:hypothetical protein
MAMERVTVEQNGERFTLEVSEGTSDDQIRSFLSQQSIGGDITKPPVQAQENAMAYGVQAAATPAIGGINYTNVSPAGPVIPGQTMKQGIVPYVTGDMAAVGKTVANNMTLGKALDLIKQHGLTGAGAEFTKAVLHPFTQQTLTGAAKNIAGGVVQGLTAPENLFTAPYNMAAYEQAKIRENPNAPGLQYNPYAQTVRGETARQSRAGEANRMQALTNMPYGNVTPQERQMLDEDAKMKSAIRKKAFEKVMGPVAPGSF